MHDVQVLDDVAPATDPDSMQEDTPPASDLTTAQNKQKLLYCERFVEFLTDLLSQLPTRRFIRTLLEDRAILIKCRMSALFQHSQGELQPILLVVRQNTAPCMMLSRLEGRRNQFCPCMQCSDNAGCCHLPSAFSLLPSALSLQPSAFCL